MAQNNIVNRWSFKEFFMSFGKSCKRVPCQNAETNESFCMLCIGTTFVGFSKSLGELTNQELATMKNELQVVQLAVNPEKAAKRQTKGQQVEDYRLCKVGESTWEEVDLGW